MNFTSSSSRRQRAGFTLMEILVVIAIILILAAISFPVIRSFETRKYKTVALNNMKQLATGLSNYTSQNDGVLPLEDSSGQDTWQNASKPENAKAWYNALPRAMGQKGVGDYVREPRTFYAKDNVMWLPGAKYPEDDKKLRQPLFAIAINTKLQRKDEDGNKNELRMANVTNPGKTVIFLEQGVPGESKSHNSQPKYDGSPKGSAKSFVARYSDEGYVLFLGGSAESVSGKDILTESGLFPFPQTEIIWTRTPEENPNKG